MSGLSGTARNGDKHYYYRCNGVQKKSGCHKHNENKYDIENENPYEFSYSQSTGTSGGDESGDNADTNTETN